MDWILVRSTRSRRKTTRSQASLDELPMLFTISAPCPGASSKKKTCSESKTFNKRLVCLHVFSFMNIKRLSIRDWYQILAKNNNKRLVSVFIFMNNFFL